LPTQCWHNRHIKKRATIIEKGMSMFSSMDFNFSKLIQFLFLPSIQLAKANTIVETQYGNDLQGYESAIR
jgi:hypothetical protein